MEESCDYGLWLIEQKILLKKVKHLYYKVVKIELLFNDIHVFLKIIRTIHKFITALVLILQNILLITKHLPLYQTSKQTRPANSSCIAISIVKPNVTPIVIKLIHYIHILVMQWIPLNDAKELFTTMTAQSIENM